MASIVNSVADFLYGLNPSLCQTPPRGLDDEFCYMGPDGTEVGAVLCKEISYEETTAVGSWMIKPERHATEGIVGGVVCALVLTWLVPKLRVISPPTMKIRHPKGSRVLSLFCLGIICYYKQAGYKNKIFWLVMPCNMQWILAFLQCFVVPESYSFLQFSMLQLRLSYLMSVVIAIVTPETDDCTLPGEFEFYWFNHFVLLLLPFAYIMNGSVSCYPSKNAQCSTFGYNAYWWLFSCIVFFLFYFGPVTLMAISIGLNLNFMLHPPHDHFLLKGESFRLVATASLGSLYTVSRILCLKVEKTFAGENSIQKSENKQD
mmetsp:Transcript_18908/g.52802  ORF Transcript_18908/g.52802 Transcript_18908/m.52802 type:complete len:317 (+) Transcript_18908:135-1085(+)